MTCQYWPRCLAKSSHKIACKTNGEDCKAYAAIDKIEKIDKPKTTLTCTLPELNR